MIVLDTHSWIWLAGGRDKLSQKARRRCERASILIVPAISMWEVAMLVYKGRIGFDRDVRLWIGQALTLPGIRLEPLTPAIAVRSTHLPGDPCNDPADRMIIATAMEYGAPIITRDKQIRNYLHVRTIW